MNQETLDSMLLSNVLELSFIKKDGSTRRMTCTKSYNLLSSFEGRSFLKYQEPKGPPRKMSPGRIVVWDIESNGFRTISMNNLIVEAIIPI